MIQSKMFLCIQSARFDSAFVHVLDQKLQQQKIDDLNRQGNPMLMRHHNLSLFQFPSVSEVSFLKLILL